MQFAEHLRKLRSGDTSAIQDFVSTYEPFIRRSLRFRIHQSALQSAADSVDICQSVLGGFLLRLSAGDYELHSEEDLRNLLFSIANKKFLMLKRRESADKRNRFKTYSLSDTPELINVNGEAPGFQLETGELMLEVAKRLTQSERELLELRRKGTAWSDIAESCAEDQTVLRQRLSRAIRRVSIELGIDHDESVS
jgi:DNA-directed RNA polymerase specialized sigma24 family protein